jgi:ABC-2 type transport system permease protein
MSATPTSAARAPRRRSALGWLVRRELAASVRTRWFLVDAAAFLLGGLLLAGFGLQESVVYGYRGFAKAIAGLVHLALLFVPLMALVPAVSSIAEDRENGTLEFILAQPVTFAQVFTGKWVGVALAVWLALTAGWGAASAVALLRGVPLGVVVGAYAFVGLLAMAFVALGMTLSAWAPSRARAMTLGLLAWLAFVALGTLGVLAAFVRWGWPAGVLVAWSFANPVEAFRLAVVTVLDPDVSLLGPVGARIVAAWGAVGTVAAASASLLAWTAGGYLLGLRLFASAPGRGAL